MTDKKVMTPEDSRWGEFYSLLQGPTGCNFRRRKGPKDYVWDCTSTSERPHARRILTEMGYDVEASLKYFDERGGHCDCEILFNVASRQMSLEKRREMRKRRRLQ